MEQASNCAFEMSAVFITLVQTLSEKLVEHMFPNCGLAVRYLKAWLSWVQDLRFKFRYANEQCARTRSIRQFQGQAQGQIGGSGKFIMLSCHLHPAGYTAGWRVMRPFAAA